MKRILPFLLLISLCATVQAQVSGNINYQKKVSYAENNISARLPGNLDITLNVKGLANVKAESYVAIFNVTQTASTAEEVNRLMDSRISTVLAKYSTNPQVGTYVDMISFVPVYEYAVEKKIFSKKTYNEVPAGFELRKNIHFKYEDPSLLNQIIADLSAQEIYDLVRVDYFSGKTEAAKKELATKARNILAEKLTVHKNLLGEDFAGMEKLVSDKYKVILPVESYDSYQAYNSSPLKTKKDANVEKVDKTETLYYQPVVDKEFDFVINPVVLEPVIQIMYEIKLKVNREKYYRQKEAKENPKPENVQPQKEFILITPTGSIKKLDIK